jgi:hypothetical protein
MPLTNECKMALNLAAGRVRETRKWLNAEELLSFFAKNAVLIDAAGKGWNHEDICKGFETLFVPYAKKNASYVVEATLAETNCLSLLFYGRMPFSPANNVPGCTE